MMNTIEVIFFTGNDCGVCKVLLEKVKKMLNEHFPEIIMQEFNIEESPLKRGEHLVFTVPTVLITYRQKELFRLIQNFSLLTFEQKLLKAISLVNNAENV